jgi:hypothetical protein
MTEQKTNLVNRLKDPDWDERHSVAHNSTVESTPISDKDYWEYVYLPCRFARSSTH